MYNAFLIDKNAKYLKKHGAFWFLTVKLILLTVVGIRNHHSRVIAESECRVTEQGHRTEAQSKESQKDSWATLNSQKKSHQNHKAESHQNQELQRRVTEHNHNEVTEQCHIKQCHNNVTTVSQSCVTGLSHSVVSQSRVSEQNPIRLGGVKTSE